MKQPIAGVAPAEVAEVPSMTVWPSIGATGAGRLVGRLAAIGGGVGVFTVGNLLAVLTIPISLVVYVWRLLPYVATRYTVTNRRVVVRKGLRATDAESIGLTDFDTIDVEVLDGQAWLRAGDVIFRREGNEVFRLAGVTRPYAFREVCRKAHTALASVRGVVGAQTGQSAAAV